MGAADSGVTIKVNRFPEIANLLEQALDDLIERTSEAIVGDIKARAPVKGVPVSVARSSGTNTIKVGDRKTFWAGFVEYGTVDQPAQPFVTPSAEGQRSSFESEASHIERRLK